MTAVRLPHHLNGTQDGRKRLRATRRRARRRKIAVPDGWREAEIRRRFFSSARRVTVSDRPVGVYTEITLTFWRFLFPSRETSV